jgi:hypothetical protein
VLQTDFLDNLRHVAMQTKEHVCRNRPKDLQPFIVANRGHEPVALVTVHEHVRDTILGVAEVVAAGFDADSIGLIFETYQERFHPEHPERQGINPVTGLRWEQDEMAEVAAKHNGIEKGWVTENVSVVCADRAGSVGMLQLPFRYSGKHLVWMEGRDSGRWSTGDGDVEQLRGNIPNALREMMLQPSAAQVLSHLSLNRAERDATTAHYLTVRGNAVIVYDLSKN